jgi:hypothetical protein
MALRKHLAHAQRRRYILDSAAAEGEESVGHGVVVVHAAEFSEDLRRVVADAGGDDDFILVFIPCYFSSFRARFLNCTFIGGPGCICSAMMPLLAAVFASLSVIWHIKTPLT